MLTFMSRTSTGAVSLPDPQYGASFGTALGRFWRKYGDFSGRSSRAEYWKAFVVYGGIQLALTIWLLADWSAALESYGAEIIFGFASLLWLFWNAAIMVPALALLVRRLRDAGRPAWLLLAFLVGIGIVPMIMAALPTRRG
jgi:uncharacterized membrane protein YhaH (DUF805 family)